MPPGWPALPKWPQEAKITDFPSIAGVALQPLGIPTLQNGPRGPRDRSTIAEETSMRAPRRPTRPRDGT
eukprot:3597353-Pyramimonas_sp.AAC.1